MNADRKAIIGAWTGLTVVLAGAFGRAVCAAEPFPWWEADAFAFAPPITGLTPVWALGFNLLIMLGAAVVLACTGGGPGRLGRWLLVAGLAVIGWHAVTDMETVAHGSDLAAGMGALVAAWAGSTLPGARRVMLGVALGFGVMLAAVGAQQMYIEHPRTVDSFERTSEAFYAARGWDPNGPEAAMYEERLSHAEPTAWFGLTNVLATFAGASTVGLIALALASGGSRVRLLAFIAAATAAAWTLITTGSKGGIGAAALAGLVVGLFWARKRAWIGRAVLAASVGVVLAVVGRGVVGERIGELSLLFRSQYLQGTVSVWAEHPVVGVGPGQFQDAYTRLKPERAPEEVTSPHSVGFDWIGLLGLGGLAWIGVLAAGWTGRFQEEPPNAQEPDPRVLARVGIGIVGFCVLLTALIGRAATAPEAALALVIGGLGWAVTAGLVAAWPGSARAGAIGVGAVAMVHAQLEVTPVWMVSAPAWGVLVGLGLGALDPVAVQRDRWRWIGPAGLVVLIVVLATRVPALLTWERSLFRAAEWPRRISETRLELSVAADADDRVRAQALADRVGAWTGFRVPADPRAVEVALEGVALRAQEDAAANLRLAVQARPTHTGTRSALGRVLTTIAMRDRERARPNALNAWHEAVEIGRDGIRVRPSDPAAWSWLGGVLEQGAVLEPARAEYWLGQAAEVWIEADPLTPHAPSSAARIAETLAQLGRSQEAADWAVRAIARDDALEIYPRRRVSAVRRAGLEQIARGLQPRP